VADGSIVGDGHAGADASAGATQPKESRIVSDDARLTVTIPSGATPDPDQVSITVLDGSSYGVEGVVYEIEPSGLQFALPVALSFRLPPDELSNRAAEVPLVTTLLDGDWVALEAHEIAVHEDHVLVTSRTTHLSPYRVTRRVWCDDLYSTRLCETPHPLRSDQPFSDCMLACMQPLQNDNCNLLVVNNYYNVFSAPGRGAGCYRICVGSACAQPDRCVPLLTSCMEQCESRYAEECALTPPGGTPPMDCEPQGGPFGDPGAGRIACPGTEHGVCELPQVCCQSGMPSCTALADCPPLVLPPEIFPNGNPEPVIPAVTCDGVEDCLPNELCLRNVLTLSTRCYTDSRGTATLPTNGSTLCHGPPDCPACRHWNIHDVNGQQSVYGVCGCPVEGGPSMAGAPPP
jgi:hypothetical protein